MVQTVEFMAVLAITADKRANNMCEPATLTAIGTMLAESWPALAASAVGTGLQYNEQQNAADRQEQVLSQSQQTQAQLGQQKQAAVLDTGQKFVGNPGGALQDAINPQAARLTSAAEDAAKSFGGNDKSAGSVSQDFDLGSAKRSADELKHAVLFAQNTAKAGGGQRMMFDSGLNLASGMSGADDIASQMKRASLQSQTDLQRAGRTNPGTMALGSFINGAAGIANKFKPQVTPPLDYGGLPSPGARL